MKWTSGFTLIELLIVITIIGILASVILPRINTARDSGLETKIIAELDGFGKVGATEEIRVGTHNVICGMNGTPTSTKLLGIVDSLKETSELFVCNSTVGAYAASAQLNNTEHWCIDSTGFKNIVGAPLASGITTCI